MTGRGAASGVGRAAIDLTAWASDQAPAAERPRVLDAPRENPSLEIVIVSYRCPELLEACLSSIEANPYTLGPCSVTVVDNASQDGTVDYLGASFPEVRVIELAENIGFSAANNVALRDLRAEHVLLLNPDTEIWPGVLDEMVAFLEAHPRAAVVGCRLVRRDGSFDHAAKRRFPTVTSALRYFRPGADNGSYLAPEVAEEDVGPVDAVNGAFTLVRAEAVNDVGLLDEGFWMYAEDLDWCYRFKQAGWEVLYNGQVTTLHVKGGVTGRPRGLRLNWAFHSSMGRFYRKHYAGENPLLDTVVVAGIGAKFGVSTARNSVARLVRRRD